MLAWLNSHPNCSEPQMMMTSRPPGFLHTFTLPGSTVQMHSCHPSQSSVLPLFRPQMPNWGETIIDSPLVCQLRSAAPEFYLALERQQKRGLTVGLCCPSTAVTHCVSHVQATQCMRGSGEFFDAPSPLAHSSPILLPIQNIPCTGT